MATSDAPPAPADSPGEWGLHTASHTGASHGATGQPNQDAVTSRRIGPDALVVAVADGHGNKRHFRSVRGAELAVAIGVQAGAELLDGLEAPDSAERIESEMRGQLVPAIVTRWREAVRADLDARPLTGEDEGLRGPGDDELIAYGSTLLLALAWRQWLILAQIGDGDVIGVRPDGSPLRPVPSDPILDGNQTTSLCGPHPEGDFRVRAVDLGQTPLLALLIATDGYGNAQAADPWPEAVSADLAELIGERDPEWFGEQLPVWAGRCASADGSGDDTTIALLIAPGAAAAQQRARLAAAAPTFKYVRSVPATSAAPATVRVDDGAGEDAGERAGQTVPAGLLGLGRRRLALIAIGAVAAVALLAVGIPLLLSLGPRGSASAPSIGPLGRPGPIGSSSPAASPSQSASPGPQHIIVRAGKVQSLPSPLPPGAQEKQVGSHTVIILLHNQIWWCASGTPRPTGCRLVDLSKALPKLHVRQQFNQFKMCVTGPNPVIELPSAPGVGAAPGGVQVTFNPQTLEASLAASPTSRCPLAGNAP